MILLTSVDCVLLVVNLITIKNSAPKRGQHLAACWHVDILIKLLVTSCICKKGNVLKVHMHWQFSVMCWFGYASGVILAASSHNCRVSVTAVAVAEKPISKNLKFLQTVPDWLESTPSLLHVQLRHVGCNDTACCCASDGHRHTCAHARNYSCHTRTLVYQQGHDRPCRGMIAPAVAWWHPSYNDRTCRCTMAPAVAWAHLPWYPL